ncbi:MAG TPA: type II CAAX endopeptidase family protein [Thermoanaerobaculia bacterium]|nr:type II CAAX endopeptidase family protein [Thermoanaerobaculia bacterium]
MEPIEPGRPADLEPVPEAPEPEAAPEGRPSPAPPPPKLALRATLLAVAFVLVVSVGAAVVGLVLNQVTGRPEFLDLAAVLGVGGAFLGAAAVAVWTARRRIREYLPLAVPRPTAWLAGVLLGLGVVLLNFTLPVRLFDWTGSEYAETLEAMLTNLQALLSPVGMLLLLGVLTPLCEEILFRGVVLRSLLDHRGAWPAIMISSVVFALFHLHPIHALIALVLGIVAGWAMVATGSLWTAFAVHATNNLLACSAALVTPEAGAAPWWVLLPAAAALAAGVALRRPSHALPEAGPQPGLESAGVGAAPEE